MTKPGITYQTCDQEPVAQSSNSLLTTFTQNHIIFLNDKYLFFILF